MAQDASHLIWLDLEMTGLNPDADAILEIATVITDQNLNVLAEGPVLVIHQDEQVLNGMDEWNQSHHGQSGLLDRVRTSSIDTAEAERQTLAFVRDWLPEQSSPICGNSIGQDRRFLFRLMPTLEAFFHYRNLDVSTLKELAARWAPEIKNAFQKKEAHRALDDVYESIAELKHYRKHFLKV
ncbi:MAG: oligoribonuclease [Methylococcales bacterium]|nr:oligoribonuclease [Methylococcales bacterium]